MLIIDLSELTLVKSVALLIFYLRGDNINSATLLTSVNSDKSTINKFKNPLIFFQFHSNIQPIIQQASDIISFLEQYATQYLFLTMSPPIESDKHFSKQLQNWRECIKEIIAYQIAITDAIFENSLQI